MLNNIWNKPPENWRSRTKAAKTGYNPFYSMGAVRPPIFACSTFAAENAETLEHMFKRAYGFEPALPKNEEYPIYTRVSNPNFLMLEDRLKYVELGADDACVTYFPSGLSAIFSTILTICNPGDSIIFGYPVYGGTHHQLTHIVPQKLGVKVIPVDATNIENVASVLNENKDTIKIVFIETPANPSLAMIDIEEVAKLTHQYNEALLIVDNTFMTPILQHPFRHNADIIVHSGTKYIGGHSDLISGFVFDKTNTIGPLINGVKVITGATSSVFDAWLILRSLDTLEIRVKQAQENAKKVAHFLKDHPKVDKVIYPDLFKAGSREYDVYQKQCEGPGSMITFDPKGGKVESYKILDNLEVFSLAVSLGGVESLAENPWFHTHSDVSENEKKMSGFNPQSIRLSIGLEDTDDLIDDLKNALNKI